MGVNERFCFLQAIMVAKADILDCGFGCSLGGDMALSYEYDWCDRPYQVILPSGRTTTFSYSGNTVTTEAVLRLRRNEKFL